MATVHHNPSNSFIMSSVLANKKSFGDVKSSINTGLHMGNVRVIRVFLLLHIYVCVSIDSIRCSAKRRGELFRRLKTTEMVTLLQLYSVRDDDEEESIANLIGNDSDEKCAQSELAEESKPYVFICHDAEHDPPPIPVATADYVAPFLLLDIRGDGPFAKYHVKGATRYDTAQLRRDRLGAEVYAFKNKADKIIVVCSDNPNEGIKFANDLCQKYIDNVFLLTTSIERFCQKYPDLCVGHSFPQKPKEEPPKLSTISVKYFYMKSNHILYVDLTER